MKKRYVNLILAMVSASAMVLGSVPAMAATDSAKTESEETDSKDHGVLPPIRGKFRCDRDRRCRKPGGDQSEER